MLKRRENNIELFRKELDGIITASKNKSELQVEFFDSGSTILNLVLSGKAFDGGWARGRVANIVGDGGSSKTILALEVAINALKNMVGRESNFFPTVKKVIVRYNNAESVMDFDIESIWSISRSKINWISSRTIQEFGRDFGQTADNMLDGETVLYILDSLDSLPSEEEVDRFEESQKKGKSIDGSFNLEKQKYLGQFFRSEILPKMAGKDITLFIISQVRMNIGVTFGEKMYRVGGKSLDFYTHQVVWLYEKEKLKRRVQDQEIVNGIRVRAKLKRSKVSKPFREGEYEILFDMGIDNVSSNLNYFFNLGGKKTGDNLVWDNKKFKTKSALLSYIEDNNQENILIEAVEKKWTDIENEASGLRGRKKRF